MSVQRHLFVAVVVCLPLAEVQAGGIYKYVLPDGTIEYTNVPRSGARAKELQGSFHRAPRPVEPPGPRPMAAKSLDGAIEAAAKKYRIPANLLRAVIHAESNFDAHAVSVKGASGLMQLMPDTAADMYVKDIFDSDQNIEGGARYLRMLANLYDGDMVKMVAAYNAGPEAVKRYGGAVPPFPETQAYVKKVIQLYFEYKEQYRLVQADRQ